MTRMVEEQRVEIGTLQALGYSKIDIAKKIFELCAFGNAWRQCVRGADWRETIPVYYCVCL